MHRQACKNEWVPRTSIGVALILAAIGGQPLAANLQPVAVIHANATAGHVPLDVVLDASQSQDPDGHIQRFDWEFGDGEHAQGAVARHRFITSGQFSVRLTVTDDAGPPRNRY